MDMIEVLLKTMGMNFDLEGMKRTAGDFVRQMQQTVDHFVSRFNKTDASLAELTEHARLINAKLDAVLFAMHNDVAKDHYWQMHNPVKRDGGNDVTVN
jgi:phytoene/squalene synthetase